MRLYNLVGKKFGKLTVIKRAGITPAQHITWLCKCDCGNKVIRTGTSIRRSKFSSCGCWSRFGKNSPHWEGVGEISAGWFYNITSRAIFKRKSRNEIKDKINITIEYVWKLFLKQNKRCALSGEILTFPKLNTNVEFKKSTASLDRIDSSKGYVKGNVQWVHKDVNIMKNIYNEKYFINMCRKIAEYN